MRIGNIYGLENDLKIQQQDKTLKPNNTFKKFFDEAINLLSATDDLQIQAEQQQIDYITGKSDDIIALTMANSRASSAIQFTSQVTNKILTAYQEIMRISI